MSNLGPVDCRNGESTLILSVLLCGIFVFECCLFCFVVCVFGIVIFKCWCRLTLSDAGDSLGATASDVF